MKTHTASAGDSQLSSPENFSIVLGGPLFQLLRRARLSDDALQLVRKRILFIALFAWLPLLLLSTPPPARLGGSMRASCRRSACAIRCSRKCC